MNRYKIIVAVMVATGLRAADRISWADGLSVETYLAVSVARLELVRDALAQEQRVPSQAEIDALWQRYGTDEEEYIGYRSRNSEQVAAYLDQNSGLYDHIGNLSAQIDALVSQLDDDSKEQSK
jgi:hypothetical protein